MSRGIAKIESFRVPPRWIFVTVETRDGYQGWGEAIVPKRAAAVEGAISDMARNIVEADVNRVEELWQRMHRGAFFRGGPILSTAAAAIEQALWDIKGKRYNLPVYEFLGGLVRERIRSYAWVGGDRPSDVVEHTKLRLQQGFTAVKMNVGAQLDYLVESAVVDDVVSRVDALRSEFGRDLGIAVDFHGRVHHMTARVLLRELEQYNLLWVEEPVAPECEDALREIRGAAGSTPIASGERLTSRWQMERLISSRLVDIVQPDVSLTGILELYKIACLAEVFDIAVAPHCPNGPISLAASLQVGYCCSNIVIQEQSQGLHYNQGYAGLPPADLTDYLCDPQQLTPTAGSFAVLQGPGLGIQVDVDAVERASGREWHLPDPQWRHVDGRLAEW